MLSRGNTSGTLPETLPTLPAGSWLQILNSCSSSAGRTPPGFRAQILSRRKRAAHYIREPERNMCSSSAGRTAAAGPDPEQLGRNSRKNKSTAAEQKNSRAQQRRKLRRKNQSGRTAPGFRAQISDRIRSGSADQTEEPERNSKGSAGSWLSGCGLLVLLAA